MSRLQSSLSISTCASTTWANNHYHDFVSNWVLYVRKCGVQNFLVGAMDDELLNALIDDKVPTFAMQSGRAWRILLATSQEASIGSQLTPEMRLEKALDDRGWHILLDRDRKPLQEAS